MSDLSYPTPQDEPDMNSVFRVLSDPRVAQVAALAPDTHPIVRTVAAFHGNLCPLLDPSMINHPAFRRVVARVIRTKEGYGLLAAVAHTVPAGWGATHADDLIDAVKNRTCAPGVAAALIGPCDTSARLLCTSSDISFAICCWGQLSPDAPTAWMDALSPEERDRLLAAVQREPSAVAHCFPWLPPEIVKRIRFKDNDAFSLLRACIEASPTAREHHAALLHQIVVQAKPIHLGLLTQLAYIMESENVWDRVCALVEQRPPSAYLVVDAVPWKNLPREVRTIVANLNLSIGAARGQHNKTPKTITDRNAAAFFAALDPQVWETLDSATQRRWKNALLAMDAYLAVQSLGLQPDILARAILHDRLVAAARLHAHDDDAVRRALFPVALHQIAPNAAHALIASMPTLPPDHGMFFVIAGKHTNPSAALPASATLHTSADLALAVTLQRCATKSMRLYDRCTTLRDVLRGRTWQDIEAIMPLLDNNAHEMYALKAASLAQRLAFPDKRKEMRHALNRLTSLPPEIAIPTCIALANHWQYPLEASEVAKVIVDALQAHNDLFSAIVDTLANESLRHLLRAAKSGDSRQSARSRTR